MIKKRFKKLDFSRISENITILMDRCGIDATKLSQMTNLPASTISRLRSSTTESSPNLSSLVPIADFFRVTLSQLIGEEPINYSSYAAFKPTKVTKLPIPVLNAENISEFLNSQSLITVPYIDVDIPVSEKAFAYVLQGNAMEPHFPDKTLLIIDPEVILENLDHLLVIPAGKKTPVFRQVMIDGDEKFLRTLNQAFNEFIRFSGESHLLLGVMVQSRRNFKNAEQVLFYQATSKSNA
jgi:transcriptional regulator with XRE-family HTH domain